MLFTVLFTVLAAPTKAQKNSVQGTVKNDAHEHSPIHKQAAAPKQNKKHVLRKRMMMNPMMMGGMGGMGMGMNPMMGGMGMRGGMMGGMGGWGY